MDGANAVSIWRCFSGLRDPRSRNRPKKHLLLDMVAIALCAVIAGANDWQQIAAFGRKRQEWLKTFLALPNGIPAHDTFERLFSKVSPAGLHGCLLRWLNACAGKLGLGHLAIDGKALRHSASPAKGLGALHLVSVWATEANLCLGQLAVDGKSNEITAIPLLLDMLDLKGALLTIDAMGCQKDIAKKVVAGGGDYVLTVKDNQKGLLDDIYASFLAAQEVDFQGFHHDTFRTEDNGHGRTEKRSYTVLYDLEGIGDRHLWEKLTAIGMCYSERTEKGVTSEELRFFIGSRAASAEVYGQALRDHWKTENCQHWVLDVTFREDDSRIQERQRAQAMAFLRRFALGLLKRHPDKASIAVKRFNAALDTDYLEQILKG
jgi:predicted transposase YbfD/YdcC